MKVFDFLFITNIAKFFLCTLMFFFQGIPETSEPEPPADAPVAPEQTAQQTSSPSNPPASGGGSLSMPTAGQTGGLHT